MDTRGERPILQVERDVAAEAAGLAIVHEVMDAYWQEVGDAGCPEVDGRWRALFSSAVAEIAGNIVRHAYPDPQGNEVFHLTLQCFGNRMEAILLDRGVEYDLDPTSRSADMRDALDDLLLDHGWGLPIARAATDSLDYERLDGGYNRWRLGKRIP